MGEILHVFLFLVSCWQPDRGESRCIETKPGASPLIHLLIPIMSAPNLSTRVQINISRYPEEENKCVRNKFLNSSIKGSLRYDAPLLVRKTPTHFMLYYSFLWCSVTTVQCALCNVAVLEIGKALFDMLFFKKLKIYF